DLRFSLPILPFIAIISLTWLEYLKEKHKVIIRYIIFAAALVSFFISSYTKVNIRIKEARIPIGFLASSPPRPRNYSIEPLIKDMIKIVNKFDDSDYDGFNGERYFGYQLLLNLPRVNKTLFELEMERRGLPIYAVSYKDYYLLSDFIIKKTGSPGPKFATMKEREKLEKIKENKEEFTKYYKLVNSYQISRDSKLKLFARRDLINKDPVEKLYVQLYYDEDPSIDYSPKVDRKKLTRILKQYFSEKFRITGDYGIKCSNIYRKGEFLIISVGLGWLGNKITINKMPIKHGAIRINDMIINQDVLDREEVIMFSVKHIDMDLAPDWSNYFHSVLKKNKIIKSIEFEERNDIFSVAKYLSSDNGLEDSEINLTLKQFNIKIGVMIDVPLKKEPPSLEEIKNTQYCLKIKYLKIGRLFKIPSYPLNGIVYRKGRLSPLDNKPISTYISFY
ncbi:hypothetical protein KAU33_01465, partial [Candidatus Dependentiae bacterium]|nr:hypothetical protein [Candidatus Dependentiae bacterium]